LLPPLPEEGALPEKSAPSDNEALETVERRDGDDVEDSSEGTDSNQSPPSTISKGKDEGRKRRCQEDLISLGRSKSMERDK
jgi:hypothetical protein